jgi:hypothetical protein
MNTGFHVFAMGVNGIPDHLLFPHGVIKTRWNLILYNILTFEIDARAAGHMYKKA